MDVRLTVLLFGILIAATLMYVFQTYSPALWNSLSLSRPTSSRALPGATGSVLQPRPGAPAIPPPRGSVQTPTSSIGGGAASSTPTIDPRSIPPGFTQEELSPYFRKVRFGSFRAGSVGVPGHLTLRAAFDGAEKINISGWLVKGYRTSQYIPRAVNVYDPQGVTAEGDIELARRESFVLLLGLQSPIGKNFRPNKCMGYMASVRPFVPPLPLYCPRPQREEVKTFTSICYDYALSLRACQEPKSNPPVPVADFACREYLKQFNFNSCFTAHRGDSDFLYPEWRGYTMSLFLDPRHDRLLLLDTKGLLVDLVEY